MRPKDPPDSSLICCSRLRRRSTIAGGVAIDTGKSQLACSMNMIKFLLAFCCGDKPSGEPRDPQDLNKCFEECLKRVDPVANSPEMKERLEE